MFPFPSSVDLVVVFTRAIIPFDFVDRRWRLRVIRRVGDKQLFLVVVGHHLASLTRRSIHIKQQATAAAAVGRDHR